MTTILVDSHPYLFHFWGGCCRAWPTWSIIISSRSSVILEMSRPFKSSVTAHARITKSLFQHLKSFTSHLPNLTQNLMHPFVRQLPSYRRYQKIADGWCNTHIKTHATINRFHIQPRHSVHSLTSTTATHPSGKLVNYKRLACYEHCPGTFGYTFIERDPNASEPAGEADIQIECSCD